VALLGPAVHEFLGQGLAAIFFRARIEHISSAYVLYDDRGLTTTATRIIAGAGIGANLVFGVLGLRLLSSLRGATRNVLFFLWLFGNANMFAGAGYLLILSYAPFGDVQALIAGIDHRTYAQLCLCALGLCLAIGTFVEASRTLDEFLGKQERMRRAAALTLIPYAVILVLCTTAAARSPESALYILTSALTPWFFGNMPMAWLALSERKVRETTLDVPVNPTSTPPLLVTAAVSIALLLVVLAPGVPPM
jgi:hypothetical protein